MAYFTTEQEHRSRHLQRPRYGLDNRGFKTQQGQDIFLLSTPSRPLLGPTRPPVQYVQCFFFPNRVKRPGRNVNHSPPSSEEVKNDRSYTSSSPICLHAWTATTSSSCFYSVTTLSNGRMSYEVERIWKVAVVGCKILSRQLPGENEESKKPQSARPVSRARFECGNS